jgi:PAS domain S-box-containing protein
MLHVNEAFKTAFGFSDEDVIGKHVRMLFTEHDQKALRPELELLMVKKQGFATDQNYSMHKNGQPIWVSGESVWVENKEEGNCIVKLIQNIHAQKLQEKFLKENNEFSHTIFKNIEDALLVINMDLIILRANASFYRMFNLEPSTLEGTSLSALEDRLKNTLKLEEKLNKLDPDGQLQDELEWTVPGGNTRTLRLRGRYLAEHPEQEKKLLLLFHDITQEKQAEQQREDLINFVSHELRNPMANLALVLELLPEAVRSNHIEETEDYLEKAKVNLRRLKQVIGELHDVTSAGTGHLAMQKATFNLQGVIREAIDTVRLLYPSHQIIPPNNSDFSVHADRFRLVQVLNNYLTNAIKYSAGADKVIIDVSRANGNLVISVTDFGPGIAEDQLPHIFNKYYRGRSNGRIEGLGLGLYVCKEIISAHGGNVWAISQPGKGSTFYFSLPITDQQ